MLRLTKEGKELMKKGGKVIYQYLSSGTYDYTSHGSFEAAVKAVMEETDSIYYGEPKESSDYTDEDWAALAANGGYFPAGEEPVYTAAEANARLRREAEDSLHEEFLKDILEDGDAFGIGVALGYLEEVDD